MEQRFDPRAITEELVGQLAWHLQAIHMRLFWGSVPQGEPPYAIQVHQARESSPLAEEIVLLCRVANGEIDRAAADEQLLAEVADTIQGIVEVTAAPALLSSYTIDDGYWATPIGELVAHAQAWLRHDDLIPAAEAARLLYPWDMKAGKAGQARAQARVRRQAEAGELRRYRNVAAGETNQERWLYSRAEVAAAVAQIRREQGTDEADDESATTL